MKHFLFIALIILGFSHLKAQNENITFSCYVSYLPSFNCSYEYYIQHGKSVKHKYEKEAINCYKLNVRSGKKVASVNLNELADFIRAINTSDTLTIVLPKEITDSISNELLANSQYFNNDSLTIIFEAYKTKFFQPDDSMFGIIPFEGIQIDGNWLRAKFIQGQDTLLELNQGYSTFPSVKGYKTWITMYLIYQHYPIFRQLQVDSYMSKNHFTNTIIRYLETMERPLKE